MSEEAGVLMVMLGGLSLSIAVLLAGFRIGFRARARRLRGVVVAHRKGPSNDGVARLAPVVEYQVDGRTLRYESGMFGTGAPSVGEEVELFVHPEDPELVELGGWSGTWTAAVVVGLLGAVFVLLGLSD